MIDHSEKHRSPTRETRPQPLTFRGTEAKESPSMRTLRLSSLRRQPSSLRKRCSFSFLPAAFALVGPVRSRVQARRARHHLLLSVPACNAEHPMLHAPKRAGRTGFGRSAPSIRTVMRSTRPRKFTGASTNLQRCKLL
jgi:hypothetical protein